MTRDGVIHQLFQQGGILLPGGVLEGAYTNMGCCHPGQDGAGKQCVPVHPVTGVGDGQAASGRNIQGV